MVEFQMSTKVFGHLDLNNTIPNKQLGEWRMACKTEGKVCPKKKKQEQAKSKAKRAYLPLVLSVTLKYILYTHHATNNSQPSPYMVHPFTVSTTSHIIGCCCSSSIRPITITVALSSRS